MKSIPVLNRGFVQLVDSMGSDLRVVNTARLSHAGGTEILDDKGKKLIHSLAGWGHWTPFRHCQATFLAKMPLFVARQWGKHQVGCSWSEVSGRYVDFDPEDMFLPEGLTPEQSSIFRRSASESVIAYQDLLDAGMPREQARAILPQGAYTKVYWTASLLAIANFIKQRTATGAQAEIRGYAEAVKTLTAERFPESLSALLGEKE